MTDPTSDPRVAALAALLAGQDDETLAVIDRLVAILAGHHRGWRPVVRTQAVELVDRDGRVRIVLGNLAATDEGDGYAPGLSLRSEDGADRATLVLAGTGPLLGFTLAGDAALLAGVDDPGPLVSRPGPYVELMGRDHHVAVGWRVTDAGVEREGASSPRA